MRVNPAHWRRDQSRAASWNLGCCAKQQEFHRQGAKDAKLTKDLVWHPPRIPWRTPCPWRLRGENPRTTLTACYNKEASRGRQESTGDNEPRLRAGVPVSP